MCFSWDTKPGEHLEKRIKCAGRQKHSKASRKHPGTKNTHKSRHQNPIRILRTRRSYRVVGFYKEVEISPEMYPIGAWSPWGKGEVEERYSGVVV
jgi:hypothetical protein